MANQFGYLTILSIDRSEIYGEFGDGVWSVEKIDGGSNNVFSGTASEGTVETFNRINQQGICNVAFDFESGHQVYKGAAQLLAPEPCGSNGGTLIKIESDVVPEVCSNL